MKLKRGTSWYRPYYVTANNKGYKVNTIKFYKDNEIIVSSNSGWLENKNDMDIVEIVLPVEKVKVRRKVKFDGGVFIISLGKEYYGNETLADVYIPADMLGVRFVGHKIMYNSQVRAVFEGEQGIYITSYVKSFNEHLNAIRNEYEETYKRVSDTSLSIHKAEDVLADIDRLKKLAVEFVAERKRINDLTIDDIEI